MAELTITFPESVKAFILSQTSLGGFPSPDAYILSLVREAQQDLTDEEIESRLLEAVESGPATPMTRADWYALRDEVHRRHVNRSLLLLTFKPSLINQSPYPPPSPSPTSSSPPTAPPAWSASPASASPRSSWTTSPTAGPPRRWSASMNP